MTSRTAGRAFRRAPAGARRGLGWLLWTGSGIVALGSAAVFGLRYVPPDALPVSPDSLAMVSAFTDLAAPGLGCATLGALGAYALGRRRAQAVLLALSLVATAGQAAALAPRRTPAPPAASSATFTVLALNSKVGAADPVGLTALARSADVVVLTEVTSVQVDGLRAAGFTERFPYGSDRSLPRSGVDGTAVFSRFPVARTRPLTTDLAYQAWVCTVELPGGPPVQVVAVHPVRPHLGGTRWLPEQRSLRAALPTSGLRLVAGDFNAVASHPTLRTLPADGWTSAVDDAGAGWVPTYPAEGVVPPVIDIDHVYVAGGLQATALRSVRVQGTDHLGLLATVAVPAER